jgi:hypothetical protein
MAAKAKPKATTAWIEYSEAKALASEYWGDPDRVECEIRRGLATGEIPCQWAHFEAPEGYSGPGPGDPEFWKFEGQQRTRDGSVEIRTWREIHIEGNSAIRTDNAAVYGLKLDRSALVRLKLLPPDDVPAKVRPLRATSSVRKERKQPQVERVLLAIPECFPDGDIDGIPDPDVRQKVGDHLEPETKKGLKVPDRRSMNRALRQYRNRNH